MSDSPFQADHIVRTAAQWSAINPYLARNDEGIESDTGKRKIGIGMRWNDTPYMPGAINDPPSDGIIYGRKDGDWVDISGEANLQIRRGTASQISGIVPLVAEPVWATDTKRMFVGDGSTTGGVPVGGYPFAAVPTQDFGSPTGIRAGSVWIASEVDKSAIPVVFGTTYVPGGTRGRGAVDLTTSRTASTQIASGEYSFAGPGANTASGLESVAMAGGSATQERSVAFSGTSSASSAFAFSGVSSATNAIAFHGTADVAGMMAHAAVPSLNASLGRGQAVQCGFRWQTSNATPVVLRRQGSVQGYPIPSGVALFGTVQVCAIQASTGTASCHYVRKFAIKNTGGTTALIGAVSTIGTDEETDAGLDVTIEANDTNDTLDIKVTGLASTTLRWVAVLTGVEQAF